MKMILMKNVTVQKLSLLFICCFLVLSCSDDDDHIDDGFQGKTKEYAIQSYESSPVEGSATFIENEDGSTTIEIELDGTESGAIYSPRLLFGNAAEGGEVALILEDIEGEDGKSSTSISKLDDNSPVKFEDFEVMDGHIVIYLVEDETETLIANGDIGGNEFTDESVTYELDAVGYAGITATVKFEERLNGTTLVTITSEDTEDGDVHPAYIHSGAIGEEQGDKVISLNPLEGGISITNVSAFNEVDGEDEEEVSFEDLKDYDGSLNIYSGEEEDSIISQGNIRANS